MRAIKQKRFNIEIGLPISTALKQLHLGGGEYNFLKSSFLGSRNNSLVKSAADFAVA